MVRWDRHARNALRAAIGLLVVAAATAPGRAQARQATGPGSVRLTLEIEWTGPSLPGLPGGAQAQDAPSIDLEVPGGRALEAISWPPGRASEPERLGDGAYRLGAARAGRARVRVETQPGATIVVRTGRYATAFPVSGLIEAPQRSADGAPVAVSVRRLPWDMLEVHLDDGPDGRGTVAPGSSTPVKVGFNVLAAEPAEGVLRLVGRLVPADGGDPVWQCDQVQRVAANPPSGAVPTVTLTVTASPREGPYTLELQAYWRANAAPEPSRLGRLIRRRRPAEPLMATATRRLGLTVVGPGAKPAPSSPGAAPDTADGTATGGTGTGLGKVVDSIDLAEARPRGTRLVASGRSAATGASHALWKVPDAALEPSALGERLWGLVGLGPEVATLAPADDDDADNLAWSALGLHAEHPDRPHRLTLTLRSGDPSALGVALVAAGSANEGRPPRLLLDTTGTDDPGRSTTGGDKEGPDTPPALSWVVWPGTPDLVFVAIHRGPPGTDAVQLGSIALEELARAPGPAIGPGTEAASGRVVGLVVGGASDLGRFGADPMTQGRNLAAYLAHCGTGTVVLPSSLADHQARQALDGQADENAIGSDRLDLVLKALAAKDLDALLELPCDGPLPGLPDPSSDDARRRGLVRLDGNGRGDDASFNPLHDDVQAAWARQVERALAARARHPNLRGVLVRLGPGSTLAGTPDVGLDDDAYARFVTAMLDGEAARRVPGRDNADPSRFEARRAYVTGPGRVPWLTWRSRRIGAHYAALAAAADHAAPGSVLVVSTPTLNDGPAGRAARLADGAGESPRTAWQAVGLDLDQWPDPLPPNLVLLRGVGPGVEPLARDLATHPDLDAAVARKSPRGTLIAAVKVPDPDLAGPTLASLRATDPDEALGHGLAALDAQWVLVNASAVAGREDRLGRFARVLRSLPAAPGAEIAAAGPDSGVSVRTWKLDGNQSLLGLANDTPYTVRVELPGPAARVHDLGLGQDLAATPGTQPEGTRVLDLPPFGVASLRVAATKPWPSAAPRLLVPEDVVAAEYRELSAHLGRLGQEGGPINPDFEAPPGPAHAEAPSGPALAPAPSPEPPASVRGWSATTGGAVAIDPARPHDGRGCLRLDARSAPAAAVGEPFAPPGGTAIELRAWLRADRPGTAVRVWVEGEAAGQPIVRRAEVAVPNVWAEQRIRVSNLPGAGLERMSLRFELVEPGRLWVDDLTVSGQRPSEPTLRAQRTLVAALQKFRERRYADFARLASSYWSRAGADGPPEPDTLRTGAATDLPPSRRLR
jgi:hypothetical protein